MCKKTIYLILLVALFAGSANAQFITSVAHRNTDADAPEEPEIAPSPLAEGELSFVDRTHVYVDIPEFILGAQYIKLANDNKNLSTYELDLTFGMNATLYVFVDNRMGGAAGGLGVAPNIDGMGWLTDMGFVDTGEDIGIDENADGSINQYYSIFSLVVSVGTVTIYGNTEGHGGNMLGVAASGPKFSAYYPDPADGAIHPETWVSFGWTAGDTAATHDVYFGDNFDDVNDGTGEAFRGNQTSVYFIVGFPGVPYPDGLVPGTTYYWRIDEIEADGATIYRGNVWSFTVPPKQAYDPVPSDGTRFIDPESVNLTWMAGFGAKLHTVYFGDNFDDVNDATMGAQQGNTTFSPGVLVLDKTYYWRVDEFDAPATHKGDVWSFSTLPNIPITDPNLVGWWKFEAGAGTTVLDFSGHANHGTIVDDVQWVPGLFNIALEFLGDNRGHVELPSGMVTTAKGSIAMWIYTDLTDDEGMFWYGTETGGDGFGDENEVHFHIDDPGVLGFFIEGASDININGPQLAGAGWTHVAATWDLTDGCRLYFNGEEVNSAPHNNTIANLAVIRLGRPVGTGNGNRYHDGLMDDVRLFDYAISAAQVSEIMTKGEDPLRAGNPIPRSNSLPGVDEATPLSWSPGENALQHDVYFGTDKDAVEAADASDTTGVYRGRQSGTTFTPAEPVEWGTGPYYWRIDEINNNGTISKGTIWTFTVADFTLIDDFESYDAGDNQIWYAWHDGLGYGVPGIDPYFAGNGTGGAVGDETTASYTEETIIHGGSQSMPLAYDNNKQGYAKYSETELTLTAPRDWTAEGVAELSLWFRGNPASVGSFVEGPAGTYTMTATGADIFGSADEFHYAFKTLTGPGSIVARVESVEQTDDWAKAGVMIRETLGAGSKFAAVYITPTNADGTATNGCRYQARSDTDAGATSDTTVATDEQMAIIAPYWVKLERDVAGNFRGYYSANGSSWQSMSWNPQSISMSSNVYVGLALTSHDVALTCEAVFSNVTITGTVSNQWANQDVGIASNAAEPLYVAVSNSAGAPAVVVHDDPAAATIVTWTEWVIPLQAFADQGIVLTDVDRIAIGLGTQGNMTVPCGSGKMYIDDIRLYRPREAAE
ncbi:MAG TPA: LamG domain-containing protein [Sedimentisphaerales bacterium]|nr:LamG domain-containing protein [Sedimentisphaerales bacterium]